MGQDLFEQFVAEALDTLPEFFQQKMENVQVVVEDWPDPETMRRAGIEHPSQLLGFYHGVPRTKRTHNYGLVLPDKISIYRQPIMMRCRNWEEVLRMVHHVLRHEVAHHFGIDDERLREIGAY
jgi:predicted Zn-dependent protease with MMP-like domain